GDIKTVTIRRASGKWFVSFSCDNVPEKEFSKTDKEVGIDVGLKHFLVDSEGNAVENPKFLRQSEKLLRRRQRSLCRKKKGANRRAKARILVGKTHEKIANQRKDFLHKIANYYVENFKTIYWSVNLNLMGFGQANTPFDRLRVNGI
ncbi:MAG: RNA-guided endonuclease InsQ/TnpB family protein, partial [Ignavibacteriales bacterium]